MLSFPWIEYISINEQKENCFKGRTVIEILVIRVKWYGEDKQKTDRQRRETDHGRAWKELERKPWCIGEAIEVQQAEDLEVHQEPEQE